MQDLIPVFKSLWRRKWSSGLMIFQLGLTISILSLIFYFLYTRTQVVFQDSGMDEARLTRLYMKLTGDSGNLADIIERDMAFLKSRDTIDNAAPFFIGPMRPWLPMRPFRTQLEQEEGGKVVSNILFTNEDALDTLGINLVEGRNFERHEIKVAQSNVVWGTSVALVSETLANKLYPGEQAIGRRLYEGDANGAEIIGIVTDFSPGFREPEISRNTVILPVIINEGYQDYLVKSVGKLDKAALEGVMLDMRQNNSTRSISDLLTLPDMREQELSQARFSIKVMTLFFLLLVLICGFGVVGLTSYRVASQLKQIGIRRALGASRLAICRYYLLENSVMFVCAQFMGAVLGPILAAGIFKTIDQTIVLPWYCVPVTGGIMFVMVMAAAAYPAFDASRVEPSSATRSLARDR